MLASAAQAHMDVQGGGPLARDAAGGMRRIGIDMEQSILQLQMEVALSGSGRIIHSIDLLFAADIDNALSIISKLSHR
jgi:hypothetical protein